MKLTKAQSYARLRDEQFSLFEDYARKHGMNSKSLLVLMWVYHFPSGMTQRQLAERTFSTKQVMQAIIKNYLKKGWVYLEASRLDRRQKIVKLTENGNEQVKELIGPLQRYEAEAMASLSEEQQEQLLAATQAYSQKFKELIENTGDDL